MTILPIETGTDNEVLRKKAVKVLKVDKRMKKIIGDMIDTLNHEEGLGLAAPQVGISERIIIVRLNAKSSHEMTIAIINPEILSTSKEIVMGEEGCLSLPDIYDDVERYKEIRVRFQDLSGTTQILDLEGMNARIIQHEMDHLDGILFVDRVKEHSKKSHKGTIAF